LVGRGTTLRDGADLLLTAEHGLGDIQAAIAGAVLREIRITVVTGTDDVQVLFLLPGRQPARTGPVAVATIIGDQPADELLDELRFGVEVIARSLCLAIKAAV
jgi:hypothetical protein